MHLMMFKIPLQLISALIPEEIQELKYYKYNIFYVLLSLIVGLYYWKHLF